MSQPSFTCPRCGNQSYAREDIDNGFCWICDDVTGGEPSQLVALPLLTAGELRILGSCITATRAQLETTLALAQAPGTRAALSERIATLWSLETAVAEARYSARPLRN